MTEDQAITHFFDDFDHFFFLRQVNSILNTPDDFHFLTADGENENVFSEDNKISEWRRMAVHFQRYLQAETFFTIAFGIREFGPPWRLADRFRNAEWNEIIGKIAKKEIPEQLIGKNKINDFSEWVSHTITAKNLNNSYIDKSHIDFIYAQAAFLSNRSVMNSFKHGNLAVRGTYKIEIDVPQIRDFFSS